MNLKGRQVQVWVGLVLSGLALWLALRQVEIVEVLAAFSKANYSLIGIAIVVQLFVLWMIAGRWRLLFETKPTWLSLLRSLLIAQLVNVVLPVRLGMFIRVYLVGKAEHISKAIVLGTILVEKTFDSLMFGLLFVLVIPFVAPDWFQWSALPTSTGLFVVLFPALVLMTLRRHWLLKFVHSLSRYLPWEKRFSFSLRIKKMLEGISPLQGFSSIVVLWGWTLLITVFGAVVNLVIMRAFDIQVPVIAAFFLLAVLQMGSRIPAPLGGMGVFQYLCVKALSFFGVDANLALSFGFMLHFVIFVPGSLLGALGLYQMHESLSTLKHEAEEQV